MNLFDKRHRILAVANGIALPLNVGAPETNKENQYGFAVKMMSGTVFCPVSGKIISVTEDRQFRISCYDGDEVTVTVGDRMEKCGQNGVISLVNAGDPVKAGNILAKVNLSYLNSNGFSVMAPVTVSGRNPVSAEISFGDVRGGKSVVMRY